MWSPSSVPALRSRSSPPKSPPTEPSLSTTSSPIQRAWPSTAPAFRPPADQRQLRRWRYIPKGRRSSSPTRTRSRTSTDGKTTVTQAAADSGGTIDAGRRRRISLHLRQQGSRRTSTPPRPIASRIYGNRNLTEFDLGTYYDDAVFDWVPPAASPRPRDVVRTETCNKCHDQLAFHGGSRRSVESASCATRRRPPSPTPATPWISR